MRGIGSPFALTSSYIFLIQAALGELDAVPRESQQVRSAKRETIYRELRAHLDSLLAPSEEVFEELRRGDGIDILTAVHFGAIETPAETATILRNGSVYFDRFVFQEYLTRALTSRWSDNTNLSAEADDHFLGVMREVARMEEFAAAGYLAIVPNPGHRLYAERPPKPSSAAVAKCAPYFGPAAHLSLLVGGVPFTTWSELRAPILGDFREDLRKQFSLNSLTAKEIWAGALCVEVFSELTSKFPDLPYLKDVSFQDIRATRDELAFFRDSLRKLSTAAVEGESSDLRAVAERTVDALAVGVRAFSARTRAATRLGTTAFASGVLLTLLGLTPANVVAALAAIGAISVATVDYLRNRRTSAALLRAPVMPLVHGLFELNKRGQRKTSGS